MANIRLNADRLNRIIDVFSVHNYERRGFPGTTRYLPPLPPLSDRQLWPEGSMLAEVTVRAARQRYFAAGKQCAPEVTVRAARQVCRSGFIALVDEVTVRAARQAGHNRKAT